MSEPSILHPGSRCRARARNHMPSRFISGEDRGGVDNREIATILRRALMDLVMAFQTIERQIHAAPDPRAMSNRR